MRFLCFNSIQMKKKIIFCLLLFVTVAVYSENIKTAAAFFSEVSERYAKLYDYKVNMTITMNGKSQRATATFKRPDRLRIDFKYPKDQCVVFDGSTLSIYLPHYRTILTQEIDRNSDENASTLGTPRGLSIMRRSYTIQYEHSAEPVPIAEGSSQKVISLVLNRKSASETFRRLKVMIYPQNKLIRRIEAIALDGTKVSFDFYGYRLNVGVSSKFFIFDAEPTAKVLNDFLFVE